MLKSKVRQRTAISSSDRLNAILHKVPFPSSIKGYNGVKIIFFITFLHRIHFYSVYAFILNLSSIRESDHDSDDVSEDSVQTAHAFLAFAFMLGPLSGILADRYFGRPKMLSFCLLLCFFGSCAQSMFHTLFELQERIQGLVITPAIYYPVHLFIVLILTIGSSGITALLLPYGVDQMEDAGETRMSSYFYWYYWFVNLGSIMSFGRYIIFKSSENTFSLLSISYLATISSFFAAVLFRLSRSYRILHRGPNIGTPLKKIFSVTKSSLVNWYQTRRQENYHENLPILDYAKAQYYGEARFEVVEDVKTFYRIVFVLVCMFGYFSIYHLLKGYYTLQAQELVRDTSPYLSSLVTGVTESIVVIICIPIVRLFSRGKLYKAKILYRVEVGICLACISVLCANLVSVGTTIRGGIKDVKLSVITPHGSDDKASTNSSDMVVAPLFLLIIPQTVIMGLSEIFAIVSTYEFVYAQSPRDMKGFTYGIMNTVYGLGTYFSSVVAIIMRAASHCPHNDTTLLIEQCSNCAVPCPLCISHKNLGILFFVVFLLFSLLYTICFFVVAAKYKRRDRQEIEKWYCPN